MNKKGFTLVELLVVIAIIGLLSTLAIVALGTARQKSRDAKRLSDLRQLETALELYYNDHTAYPTGTNVTLGNPTGTGCLNGTGFADAGCTDAYMGLVPADPGSNAYTYNSADGTTYSIDATLEGTSNNFTGNIQATPSGLVDTTG